MKSGKPDLTTRNETAAQSGFACTEWLGINSNMKTYIVAVAVGLTYPPKHWWSESTSYSWLPQYLIQAETEEVANAMGVMKAMDGAKKKEPKDTKVVIRSVNCWDITDRLKDA